VEAIAAIADFLKLDYFSSSLCDRPVRRKKSTVIAFSFAMVAIIFTNGGAITLSKVSTKTSYPVTDVDIKTVLTKWQHISSALTL
jgi:hypothetical protein